MITKDQIVRWLEKTAAVLQANKTYLTDLDSAIGDADHGTNMDRGFKKVMEKLPTVSDKDVGNILKTTGMTLISSVGGASGPLYGTFFMRSGMAMAAKEELSDEEHRIFPGDYEAQKGQGDITWHNHEHLGTTDQGIVMLRRFMLRQVKAVQDGRDPVGVAFTAGEEWIDSPAGNWFEEAPAG